jgi:antitoxin MazE
MKTRLQRWGNSLGIRIPKTFAEETGLDTGSLVDLSVDSRGRLVIEPVRGPKYELAALLDGITDENLHPEAGTGRRRGREAW